MTCVTLKELELHRDEHGYFLSAVYLVDDDHRTKEIRFPRLDLDLYRNTLDIRTADYLTFVDIGLGKELVARTALDKKTGKKVKIIEEVIQEKTHEMTVSEIEKKLGYKIKIVSEDKRP